MVRMMNEKAIAERKNNKRIYNSLRDGLNVFKVDNKDSNFLEA